MCWDRFEVSITNSFTVTNKDAGTQVHTDKMKIQLLKSKVKTDVLVSMKRNIGMQMIMV